MPVPTATLLLLLGGRGRSGVGAWPGHRGGWRWIHFPPTSPLLLNATPAPAIFNTARASRRAVLSPLSVLRLPLLTRSSPGDGEMRVGAGGEIGAGLRGAASVRRRKCGTVVEDGEASGCSASSTSRGSSARGSSGGDSVSRSHFFPV
jgi:hypothetical protein